MKRILFVSALLTLGFVTACPAQKADCMDRIGALNTRIAVPAQQWTPASMNDMLQEEMTIYADCFLWDPDLHKLIESYVTPWEPTIKVDTAGTGLRSPYNSGKVITFPSEFAVYLFAITAFLGHDADMQSSSIHLPYELASTPFRRTQLAPLFDPLSKYLDLDFFLTIWPYLNCPERDQGCKVLLGYAAEFPVVFVLLHENAHQRLQHVNRNGFDREQELAADAYALAAFRIIRDSLLPELKVSSSAKSQIRWLFDVAPAIWLKADSLRLSRPPNDPHGQAAQIAEARLQAVVKADPAISKRLLAYITPEHSRANMATIRLQFDHPVQSYVIDGIRVLPSQLPVGGLIVCNDLHTVVALSPEGVGVSRGFGDPDFTFSDYTLVSLGKIQKDRDDEKWELVLAETSDINLQPRSPAVARAQSVALDRLGLGAMIAPGVVNLLKGEDLETVQDAQRNAIPLSSWRYSADRAAAH